MRPTKIGTTIKTLLILQIKFYRTKYIAAMLLLVKCYDNKMVKSPYNCVIFPLTQPQPSGG